MIDPPRFDSLNEIENSTWLKSVKDRFANNEWPTECTRCKESEDAGLESVRMIDNKNHLALKTIKEDYLKVDVVVNTICNAACPICSEEVSSKIAKLKGLPTNSFDGLKFLDELPLERIIQLDVLGGEPGSSKRTKKLLGELDKFHNLQTVHLSTNGLAKIPEVKKILETNRKVDLVISMDGVESVFEYCRFPIKWKKFEENLQHYRSLQKNYSNLSLLLWCSISALCVGNIPKMLQFSRDIGIPLNGAPIFYPRELWISNKNFLTLPAKELLLNDNNEFSKNIARLIATEEKDNSEELASFLSKSDKIRNIDYKDYII